MTLKPLRRVIALLCSTSSSPFISPHPYLLIYQFLGFLVGVRVCTSSSPSISPQQYLFVYQFAGFLVGVRVCVSAMATGPAMLIIDRGEGNDNVKGVAKGKLGRGTGGAAESVYEGRAGLLLMPIALAKASSTPRSSPLINLDSPQRRDWQRCRRLRLRDAHGPDGFAGRRTGRRGQGQGPGQVW